MNTDTNQQDIKDVIPDRTNTGLMITAAWYTLTAGIWPHDMYNKETEALAKDFIRSFIVPAADPYRAYAEFCQRILMARHYLERNPWYEFTCSIQQWLDPNNAHGFEGTADWFGRLLFKRKADPIYLIELKAFPEALLELAEDPSPEIFHYWAAWFLERKAYDQYLMLQLAGAQLGFRIKAENSGS